MVVQVQSIFKSTSKQAELLFKERATRVKESAGRKIADVIVNGSPIDTGTYIMAHVAGSAQSAEEGSRSSKGKKRGRAASQFKNIARGNLHRSVSARALSGATEIWFLNRALHAPRVEYLGWDAPLFGNPNIGGRGPYYVYAQARRRAAGLIGEAAREQGFETR